MKTSVSARISASIRWLCCARLICLPSTAASSPAARRSRCRWRACSSGASEPLSASCAKWCGHSSSSASLSKDEILALYLSLAPYGGNLEGVRAASLAYFGKEPRRLSLGEAALLVALPQSPEARRPDRGVDNARKARDRVLDRVAEHVPFLRNRNSAPIALNWTHFLRRTGSPSPENALVFLPTRSPGPRPSRFRPAASRCRCLRRMPPMLRSRRRPRASFIASPSMRTGSAASRNSRATARGRSGPTFPSRSSRSIMHRARCARAWRRPTISTNAAPARST